MEHIVVTWQWYDGEYDVTEVVCLEYSSVKEVYEKISDAQKIWFPLYEKFLEEDRKWCSGACKFPLDIRKRTPKIVEEIKKWESKKPKEPDPFVKIGERTLSLYSFVNNENRKSISFMPEIMSLQDWLTKKLNEREPWEK